MDQFYSLNVKTSDADAGAKRRPILFLSTKQRRPIRILRTGFSSGMHGHRKTTDRLTRLCPSPEINTINRSLVPHPTWQLYFSDTLLIDRWNEILNLHPQLVKLITWNDFGESHYIGPLHPERTSVNTPSGDSDGAIQWDVYQLERLVLRVNHQTVHCCLQKRRPRDNLSQRKANFGFGTRASSIGTGPTPRADGVWAATLLASPATLTMTSGTCSYTTTAPAGINYFATGMGSGQPTFKLVRNGVTINQGTGGLSTDLNSCNIYNFNAFVGSTN
ncbi:glycosyl hydrolase family 71-domain-containing protein [Mycena galopus ATCC 62051]|nr:glycosyl hydrolase family 71-domain-containing protein [Mycena galopus ATCC 62051]